jgi:hypothetical protein
MGRAIQVVLDLFAPLAVYTEFVSVCQGKKWKNNLLRSLQKIRIGSFNRLSVNSALSLTDFIDIGLEKSEKGAETSSA